MQQKKSWRTLFNLVMFVCNKCGLCCRNIDKIEELSQYDNGNGVCIYLTDDNLCAIYDTRPDICNTDKMYKLKYSNIMTPTEYANMNKEGCELLELQKEY